MFTLQQVLRSIFSILFLLDVAIGWARVIETTEIKDILPSVEAFTLVLFDVDDTLLDSTMSLNSGRWIKYYHQTTPSLCPDQQSLLDCLKSYVTKHIPVKTVEVRTPEIVKELQKREGVSVFALTARSALAMEKDESLSLPQLRSLGFDFEQTKASDELAALPSFYRGIIFTSGNWKGKHLQQIMEQAHVCPNKVVFIDDKLEQVQSVDSAMQEWGIPCDAFWYRRAEKEHPQFELRIAIIQLHHLVHHQEVLTDAEAASLEQAYDRIEIEGWLQELIQQYELKYCRDEGGALGKLFLPN